MTLGESAFTLCSDGTIASAARCGWFQSPGRRLEGKRRSLTRRRARGVAVGFCLATAVSPTNCLTVQSASKSSPGGVRGSSPNTVTRHKTRVRGDATFKGVLSNPG